MKKKLSALLAVLVLVPSLAACTPAATTTTAAGTSAGTTTAAAAPAEMTRVKADDVVATIDDEGYKWIDLRKSADVEKSTVKNAVPADLSVVVEGNDVEAGKAALEEAIGDFDGNLVLVCYTGNKYAQAATDALNSLGYDLSKVVTLEDGFKGLEKSHPEVVVKK